MVNAELRTLHEPDGTPVCNGAFDLSTVQLTAAAKAAGEIRTEHNRGQTLSTDEVLALRELTGVVDELDRLAETQANATVVLPLARLVALHDALGEWVRTRTDRGWLREGEAEALAVVGALLEPLAGLRTDALHATLGARAQTPGS